jgi:kynurenine formamidase
VNAAHVTFGTRTYRLGRAVDLAIPLDPHGPQPNAYGVPDASARPYSGDGFTLDTRAGGSCNCETITLTPHCNGTHTESVGHLTRDRLPITAVELPLFIPCSLISVAPHGREIRPDAIAPLTSALPREFLEALVVRSMPNPAEKLTRRWEDATTPYFTPEAMAVIRSRGVNHLLVDLPSLDPLRDDGRLNAHRVFWDMPPGSQELPDAEARRRTITEMIFVPDDVPDGRYLLSIQLPRIVSDAVPSRPILFFLVEGA